MHLFQQRRRQLPGEHNHNNNNENIIHLFLLIIVAQHSVVATYIRGYSIVELGRSQVVGGVARGWGIIRHKYVLM